MKLEKIVERLDAKNVCGALGLEISGITHDSRKVQEGWLFVAVAGHRVDGAEYIAEAMSNGAAAVVSENKLDLGRAVTHVQVPCARTALALASCVFYGDLSQLMEVVGITGTNGKTTTGFMIRDLLHGGGRKPGLIGTVAYEIGTRSIPASRTTPESPEIHALFRQMRDAGCDSVVMEVSSHAIALKRAEGIRFKTVVFTNLTQDHLDYHKDMESYFRVKAELFRSSNRAAVINVDDPWGYQLAEQRPDDAETLTYGFGRQAMVRASAEKVNKNGTSFHVTTPWGEADVHLRLLGRFNIYNALAAIAAGGLQGLALKQMTQTLDDIQRIPGRLELVKNRLKRAVFVDYAHTDDALKNVLTTLREICKGRLLVVFGCGGNRDEGKRALMGRVAAQLADHSIITSDNPRNENPADIANAIISGFAGGGAFEVELDRLSAIRKGIGMMGANDVLLVAGKGHETYQESGGTIVPFDDREAVREVLS